jgi:collagenase-like PrtC family protease
MENGWIGGGRTAFTLRHAGKREFARTLTTCAGHGITFNYLLNAASLYGIEHTRAGQKKIRSTLDSLGEAGVKCLTVSLPYLLRIIKKCYPGFSVKIGVFAQIDTPEQARRWEELGADVLGISAISCNRDFERLAAIRTSVRCELQLIVNALCTPSCIWEHTHMDLLSQSSRRGDPLGGFCVDYCYLHCSAERFAHPERFIRSIWIRPEDMALYESMGYDWFKLVERSCPDDLLLRRVAAYDARSFTGNLMELIAPTAFFSRKQQSPFSVMARSFFTLARPLRIRLKSVLAARNYASESLQFDFSKERAPVYIENSDLAGFLEGVRNRGCSLSDCDECGFCKQWSEKAVRIDPSYRSRMLEMADKLDKGFINGSLW